MATVVDATGLRPSSGVSSTARAWDESPFRQFVDRASGVFDAEMCINSPSKPPALPERINTVLQLREWGHEVIRSTLGGLNAHAGGIVPRRSRQLWHVIPEKPICYVNRHLWSWNPPESKRRSAGFPSGTSLPRTRYFERRFCLIRSLEADMPIILWLLGVPLVVVVLLMLTHMI
jgi:hypothetical protein